MILQRQDPTPPSLPVLKGRPRLRRRQAREEEERDRMVLKWEHLATWKVREKCYGKKLKWRGRLNGFLSFSVSPVNLGGLCGSRLLNI